MAFRLCAGASPVFLALGRRAFSRCHLVVVAGLVAACSGGDAPAAAVGGTAVVDDAGRQVSLTPAPRRIISLAPSATELLIALGASAHLVARTDFDNDASLARLPTLGRTLSPSLETVVALRPDLVITASDALTDDFTERLIGARVRVYQTDTQRLSELFASISTLSVLVGEAARGEELLRATERALGTIREAAVSGLQPRVLYLLWHSPAFIAGRDTYIDDLIRIAGGRNVFADVAGWAQVSLEEIIARDPELIVVPRGEGHSLQPEWLVETAGWRGVRAVREDRLLLVDSDLFNRPGPRVVEAAQVLASALRKVRAP